MSTTGDLEKQLADLQSKYAFQQQSLDNLNDVVIKQWEALDKLARLVGDCANQIIALNQSVKSDETDPLPPHY